MLSVILATWLVNFDRLLFIGSLPCRAFFLLLPFFPVDLSPTMVTND
jgi:hypothetical protein